MKFLHKIIYVLLLAIVTQMGDGIFAADEGKREYLKGIPQASMAVADVSPDLDIGDIHFCHGSFDEITTDLADMPQLRMPSVVVADRIDPFPSPAQSFASVSRRSIYRPPVSSLS